MSLVKTKNITKEFPGTIALKNVSIEINKGEVVAICGENGAGKSTLMNIIGGVFEPTSGEVYFDSQPVTISNTKIAQKLGVGFVHQELMLCEHLTVAENIYIGRLPEKNGMIDYSKLNTDSEELLAKFKVRFKPTDIVANLTVSEKQIIEIVKAVALNCKLLILDEPTSSLTDSETQILFTIIRELRNQGISIAYISHRMTEIFEVCDRVIILRDGELITTLNVFETTEKDIIKNMVGRELSNLYPDKGNKFGGDLLKVTNLTDSNDLFSNISFNLREGEILGFAGLVGSGRTEIMKGLCGINKIKSGEIYLKKQKVELNSFRDSIKNGLMYVTEDRKHDGLFLDMNIKDNTISTNLNKVSNGELINSEKSERLTNEYVKKLNIKIANIFSPASSLSGGNQQKVVISKWLSNHPKIIIMDEPTRGIDVGAKSEIHNLLRELANNGIGVIIISSELPELIGVCDRIAVIAEGKLTGILDTNNFSEENIMELATV